LVGTSVVDTLDGGAGNDKCIAVVAGSLYSAAATVRIQGRSGHDTIYFSGAKLLSNSQTDLLVQAGGGNDNVTVNHSPTSQTHSTSRLSMLGEGGNDNLTLNVQSKLIGSPLPGMPAINFNMDGGANNDVVSANLSLLAVSDGPVGHPQQLATVRGGSQNDELHFSIWMVNVMSPIWARVIGDQGKDKAFRDPVILSDPTVEEDYINA
jgi:Ca2+-binding RTX toxin-like protein